MIRRDRVLEVCLILHCILDGSISLRIARSFTKPGDPMKRNRDRKLNFIDIIIKLARLAKVSVGEQCRQNCDVAF